MTDRSRCLKSLPRAAGTGGSVVVDRCQVCGSTDLESVLFLGYLPPVNQMRPIGQRPHEQPAYPAELLHCPRLPARAARPHRRSRDSVSARVSVHQRHDADSARELRRAAARSHAAPRSARHRAGRRHRVERRHAARELQGRRPPRVRRRADADGEPGERARHPHDHELLRARRRRAGRGGMREGRTSSPRRTSSRTSKTSTRSSTAC